MTLRWLFPAILAATLSFSPAAHAAEPQPPMLWDAQERLPKPGTFTSLRNLLYGLEWWVFGAFAAFLWWRWCRDDLDRVRSGTAAAEAGEDAGQAQVRSSP